MRVKQVHVTGGEQLNGWSELATEDKNTLVLAFGSVDRFSDPRLAPSLREAFPHATIVGCTTAGEITARGAFDGSLTVTRLQFDATPLRTCVGRVADMADSEAVGARLGGTLAAPDLRLALVLSDGVGVNGSALVKGLRTALGPEVQISGGLAGDNGKFERTLLLHDDQVEPLAVVAVGFYGSAIRARHGCVGGWAVFGPRRKVTKAARNVVYELDHRPILEMYEHYLGDEAKDLPGSGLLYPLAVLSEKREATGIIRTLLAINRQDGSITFAGDIDEGTTVQLMYAQEEQLIQGAADAARHAQLQCGEGGDALAVLVSCVGRKLLMPRKIGQEVKAVANVLGQRFVCTGFYSNGEIGPHEVSGRCELHNETMTIATLCEDSV